MAAPTSTVPGPGPELLQEPRRVADLTPRVKVPPGTPRIRDWYVERKTVEAEVCDLLDVSSSGSSSEEPRMVGLAGPGGAGKSTVASMVIAREDVRASFHKGVLWLPVGQGAKERLPSVMFRLAVAVYETVLSKTYRPPRKAGVGMDPEDGVAYIQEVVDGSSRRFLVVADNVWEVEVLEELERAGVWVLYTTRQDSLLPAAAPLLRLDQVLKGEAETVLRRAASLDDNAPLPEAAYDLMTRCELSVMHLSFVGRWGVVRGRIEGRAWQTALDRILEAQQGGESGQLVSWRAAVLDAGLEALAFDNLQNAELYLALAVIPKGLAFSPEVVAVLLYGIDFSKQDLRAAGRAAAALERWSILTRESGGNYHIHQDHSEFVQRVSSEYKDLRDRVLPRWRTYISGIRALLMYPDDALVAIWAMLARVEDDVLCRRPYDSALEAMDPSSAELPEALAAAAGFHWVREDWVEAYAKCSELLAIEEDRFGVNSLNAARTLYALGWCCSEAGRPEQAEHFLRRALSIQEGNLGAVGAAVGGHRLDAVTALDVASTLHALGVYALESGRVEEAEEFLERALAVQQERLGAQHPDVASTLHFLEECAEEAARTREGAEGWDLVRGAGAPAAAAASEGGELENGHGHQPGVAPWLCFCCGEDDACADDDTTWCLDKDEEAGKESRVFIPDASRNKYVVVGLAGATVRTGARVDSPVLSTLPVGTETVVAQVRSRRAHILQPVNGWVSLSAESGYVIVEALPGPTQYKVVFPGGIYVRDSPSIDDGKLVRVEPFGAVLNATGKTEIFDAVERVEIEGGWVSMRLREDDGSGEPLLMVF
ncbi:unnamed protein product [Pylaiella littoralis]